MGKLRLTQFGICIALTCAHLPSVQANTVPWASPTDGVYGDGSNWIGGNKPAIDDTALFDTGGVNPYTVSLTSNESVTSIDVANDSVTIDLAGNDLNLEYLDISTDINGVQSKVNVRSGNVYFGDTNLGAGIFVNNGSSLTLDNTNYTWRPSYVGGFGVDVGEGSSLNVINGSSLDERFVGGLVVDEGGTLLASDVGSFVGLDVIVVNGEGIAQNGAVIDLTFGAFIRETGDLEIIGNGTKIEAGRFENIEGTLTVSDGAIAEYFYANISSTGTVYLDNASLQQGDIATGGQLNVDGELIVKDSDIVDIGFTSGGINVNETGVIELDNALIQNVGVNIDGGRLTGNGIIDGNLTNTNGGTVDPGLELGSIIVDGNFMQDAISFLIADIGGLSQGIEYDYLNVSGTATLGGVLDVNLLISSLFTPNLGDSFEIITADTINSKFDELRLDRIGRGLDWRVIYDINESGLDSLRLAVVTEPPILWLMAVGLGLIGISKRRKLLN